MKRADFKQLQTLKKDQLVKTAADAIDRADQTEKIAIEVTEEKLILQSKVQKITELLAEAFDGDGVNDITLPTGKNILTILWWAVTNAKTLLNLVKEVIAILKEKEVSTFTKVETKIEQGQV